MDFGEEDLNCVLQAIYRLAGGRSGSGIDSDVVFSALSLDEEAFDTTIQRARAEGYIAHTGNPKNLSLTITGISRVRSLPHPPPIPPTFDDEG